MRDKRSPFSPFQQIQSRAPQPPSVVIDRMGRMIEAGHLVLFHAPNDLVFEVVAISPVLNPSIPDGQKAMQLSIRAEFNVQTLAAMRDQNLIVVGETEARSKRNGANGPVAVEEIPQEPSGIMLTDGPVAVPDPATEALEGPQPTGIVE